MCYIAGPRCAEVLIKEMRKVNKEFAYAKTHHERLRLGGVLNNLQVEYDGTPERLKSLREDIDQTQNKHERARKLGYLTVCEQGYQNRILQSMIHVAKMKEVTIESLLPYLPSPHPMVYSLQTPVLHDLDLAYRGESMSMMANR